MGFFTSGTDKRIEEIKATVKQLNKDLLILADMVRERSRLLYIASIGINGCFWSNY